MKTLKFIINGEEQEIPSHKGVDFLNGIQGSVDITGSNGISIDKDNNTINIRGKEYTPGPLIDIKGLFNYYEYLRGPCAEGFHVPVAYTWDRIRNFGITLGAWSSGSYNNIKTYLKLPFGGYVSNLGSSGGSGGAYYWLANTNSSGSSKALKITSSSYSTSTGYGRAHGMFIRPEKDEAVIPDASWTTLYDGSSIANGAGIFHNSTLGLISISADGSRWITIADKNIGATVIYNNGDTLDSTNCGSFFQWGNCYPFPYSLNMVKSSTRVDASGYGPTNLYYGRVFICGSGISDWSSVNNGNLWGWYSFDDRSSKFNVIIGKGIFSINGKTGYSIHLNSNAILSSEAPNDIETGLLWYDTTNDQLKVYDGTNWNEVGGGGDMSNYIAKDNTTQFTPTGDYNPATKKYVDDSVIEYNEGEGIEIGTIQDYSAMRGPAPEGFHVPQSSEWTTIIEIWKSLGGGASAGNDFLATLKMPKLGYLQNSNGAVNNENNYGYYWTCTPYTSITVNHTAYHLQIYNNNSTISATEALVVPCGMPVRCFKDIPVTPDTSWTKLYGTSIEAGGVFHNSSLGLISLSGDGETWITIQDKNIGATQVYNSGDTKTKYNCGGYLQRGNNYVFEYGETLTTSSTQVDASSYGPGNYYSSSTFITTNSSPNDWSSVQNNNLRGGETGVVTINNAINNKGVLSVNGQTGDVPNVVTGDGQYVIKASTTAPASGTANNIITLVIPQ